jgi:hypothetical protein
MQEENSSVVMVLYRLNNYPSLVFSSRVFMIHQFSKFWKFCFLRRIETSLVIMFCTQDTVFVYLRSLLFCQKFCMMSVIFLRKIETSLDIIIFCTQGAVFVYLIISNSKNVLLLVL